MIAYARALGLRALEAFTFVENPASARVLRKAGFADLGVARRDYPMRGGRGCVASGSERGLRQRLP